jgi:hypothetical protein
MSLQFVEKMGADELSLPIVGVNNLIILVIGQVKATLKLIKVVYIF